MSLWQKAQSPEVIFAVPSWGQSGISVILQYGGTMKAKDAMRRVSSVKTDVESHALPARESLKAFFAQNSVDSGAKRKAFAKLSEAPE